MFLASWPSIKKIKKFSRKKAVNCGLITIHLSHQHWWCLEIMIILKMLFWWIQKSHSDWKQTFIIHGLESVLGSTYFLSFLFTNLLEQGKKKASYLPNKEKTLSCILLVTYIWHIQVIFLSLVHSHLTMQKYAIVVFSLVCGIHLAM